MNRKVIDLFRNKKDVPDAGVKYSSLLEKFMHPFMDDFKDFEFIEDIFEFAINAWNFGNIKAILPPEEFDKTRNDITKANIDFEVLNRMIDYKVQKFIKYDNFIIDYELDNLDGGAPVLSVVTEESQTYLSNMLNALDSPASFLDEDFEENYINRSAIIIKPKQPFIDWYNSLYPDKEMHETDVDIYLVDDTVNDLEKFLRKKFNTLFTMVLYDWHTNKKEWPQRRNYKMFKEWFRVETSATIYDLEKKPVSKSE